LAVRGGIALFCASTLVNVTGFLFHVVVSRDLSTSDYGALAALLGLFLVFAVPSVALQTVITKEVASRRGVDSDQKVPLVIGPLLAQSLAWGLVATLALVAVAPLLNKFLRLGSLQAALMLAAYGIPVALGLVPRAVLLGELRFRRVAVALTAGAVVRLGLVTVLLPSRGVEGAMAATVLAELVSILVMLPALRDFVSANAAGPALRVRWHDATAAVVAFGGYWSLTGLDTLLARHFLSSQDSGFYAASATASRMALFLPASVALVMFPRFAETRGKGEEARAALVHALAVVGLLGLAASVVLIAVPEVVISLLFGDRYSAATTTLRVLAVAALGLSLMNILMQYHLAAHARLAAALPCLGVVGASVGITLFHSGPLVTSLVMLVSVWILVVVMAKIAFHIPSDAVTTQRWLGRDLWEVSEPDVELTMVMPFYNPGVGVTLAAEKLIEALHGASASFEIIAVSDGSTDGSAKLLESIEDERFRVVTLPTNAGKGNALRTGLAMGRGRYLGFIDGDGDVDPSILASYLALVRTYEPDIVLGSKRHPMSEVHYPRMRHLYSWGYQLLTFALFRTKVRDTQTGLKLIKRDVLAAVLPRMLEKRFAFDLELLVVAKHLGFPRFFEAPIKIDHQFTSTINAGSVRGMLIDTLAIFYRLQLLRTYDYPPSEQNVAIDEMVLDVTDHTSSPTKRVEVPHLSVE